MHSEINEFRSELQESRTHFEGVLKNFRDEKYRTEES